MWIIDACECLLCQEPVVEVVSLSEEIMHATLSSKYSFDVLATYPFLSTISSCCYSWGCGCSHSGYSSVHWSHYNSSCMLEEKKTAC